MLLTQQVEPLGGLFGQTDDALRPQGRRGSTPIVVRHRHRGLHGFLIEPAPPPSSTVKGHTAHPGVPPCWPVSGLAKSTFATFPSPRAQWFEAKASKARSLTVARTAQVGCCLKDATALLPVELQCVNRTASTNAAILGETAGIGAGLAHVVMHLRASAAFPRVPHVRKRPAFERRARLSAYR